MTRLTVPTFRNHRRWALSLVAAITSLVAVCTEATTSLAIEPLVDGRIVFWYDVPGDGSTSADLVTINPDGTDLTIVVDSSDAGPVNGVGHPSWSPDGKQIAFAGWSTVISAWTVFIVDADGSDLTMVTYTDSESQTVSPRSIWNIDWAPDGRIWMAGESSQAFAAYDPILQTMTKFSSPTGVNCGGYCPNPTVSPDGTKLAFSDWTDVWVAPINDLSTAVKVMRGNSHVTWTPDGKVAAREDNSDGGVVVAEPIQNATPVKLNENGVSPAFAPSGDSFLYLVKGGNNTLYRADIDGTDPVNLTEAWGLNGKMGAMDWYGMRPPSAPERPTVKATGTGAVRLTWTAPASTELITEYTARAYTQSIGGEVAGTCTTTSDLLCTITGLQNGTKYWFTVTATSAGGDSVSSPRASATTWDLPGAPRNMKVKSKTRALQVNWDAPADSGGTKVTRYEVEVFTSAIAKKPVQTCSTGKRSCTVEGLKSKKTYWISVQASNAVGTGQPTERRSTVTK